MEATYTTHSIQNRTFFLPNYKMACAPCSPDGASPFPLTKVFFLIYNGPVIRFLWGGLNNFKDVPHQDCDQVSSHKFLL